MNLPFVDWSEWPYNPGSGPSVLIGYMALALYDYPHFRGGVTARWDGTTIDNATGNPVPGPKVIVPNSGDRITSLRMELKALRGPGSPKVGTPEAATVHNTTHLEVFMQDPVRGQLTSAWDARVPHWNISWNQDRYEWQMQQRQLETRPGLIRVQASNYMDNGTDGDRRQGTVPDFEFAVEGLVNV